MGLLPSVPAVRIEPEREMRGESVVMQIGWAISPSTNQSGTCHGNISRKHVPLPIIPEMSAIIRAGDDLAFTSALFDGIPANRDEVCWLPIYEGFLQ